MKKLLCEMNKINQVIRSHANTMTDGALRYERGGL